MVTLQYVVNAQDAASATFERIAGSADHLLEKLDEIGAKTARARLKVEGGSEAELSIDKLDLKMAKLAQRVATGKIGVEGQARALLDIRKVELEMDKLNAKRAKIHIDTSGLSAFKPSAMGAALALTPALIPLAASVAAGVGAIAVSFAAAGVAAAGFGLMAGTVLKGASQDLQKLNTLHVALLKATTNAQKKAAEQAIAALTAGWSKGYLNLIDIYKQFQQRWKSVSQAVTVPALTVWLQALTRGLQFLKPAMQPIADLFVSLGQSLNAYFANNAGHLRSVAAAFGQFAQIQLVDIARFIMDIAKGIFNLGKDLTANGANFSSAGTWLARMGDGFLAWSKSAAARRDVHGFMKFLHDEGPVVKGILKDLGILLPGIFAGATTVGTMELQALGNFLNLVANLPKGWQKPFTEFAGAMLLLSKIGVVKVGLKLVGAEALAASLPAAGGPMSAAGAAMAAGVVLKFREDLKTGLKNSVGAIGHDLAMVTSGLGGFAATGAQGLADTFVNHFRKIAVTGMKAAWHEVAASFDAFRHDMSASFAALRHDLSASFAALRHDLAASARRTWHDITSSFDAFRHDMSASFAALRHDIATAWDTIWRNTVTRARNGINDAIRWFRTITPRAIAALSGLGTQLYNFAHQALVKFGNGAKSVWASITKWFSGLPGTILHALGIHSPPDWAVSAGRHVMQGILNGLHLGSGGVAGFIGGLPGKIGALLGGGSSGAVGGDALANKNLARRIFPWGAAQWPAFVQLEMMEAGFNRFARNQSSGAYGIPQALPPTKMPFAAQAAGGSHAGPQLSWMFAYLAQRYGTPMNALAHENAFHWYDRGGWLPVGASLAYNATGQAEQVVGPASMAQVVALLAQILAAVRVAPAATSVGLSRSLNSAARAAVGAR